MLSDQVARNGKNDGWRERNLVGLTRMYSCRTHVHLVKINPLRVDTKFSPLYNYQGACVCMDAYEVHLPFKPSNMANSQARCNARRGAWVAIWIYYIVTNISNPGELLWPSCPQSYPCILHLYQLNLKLNYLKNFESEIGLENQSWHHQWNVDFGIWNMDSSDV